jgi:hypothetical protein
MSASGGGATTKLPQTNDAHVYDAGNNEAGDHGEHVSQQRFHDFGPE